MAIADELATPAMVPRARGVRWRPGPISQTVAVLLVLDLATLVHGLWVAQAVALAVLLVLPGFLVLRALRFLSSEMLRSPAWLVSTSLVALMAVGLAVDLLAPPLGVRVPLTTVPLAVAVNAVCLALAILPGPGAPVTDLMAHLRHLDGRATWSLLVPAVAAVGALRLNNGHGSAAAVAGAAGAVGLLTLGVVRARSWSAQRLGWILFSATAALLLEYSLRSDYVFGWDISAEFSLMQKTVTEGVWSTAHPGDAYGAMLSLTVLPAILHSLAGISPLVLVKLVLPVLFALMPVVVHVLLRRFLGPRSAFVGATLLLTLPPFVSEMPALARQEVALLLFVSLLAAMLDTSLPTRGRTALLGLLSAGVVVAHYSTTYTLVTVLAGAVVVQLLVARYHGVPRFDTRKLVVLGVTVLLGFGWYQGVTSSTAHVVSTVSQLLESGLQILPSAEGESALDAYLRGPKPPETVTVRQYQTEIAAEFARDRPWVVTSPAATEPRWALRPAATDQAAASPSRLLVVSDLASLVFSQLLVLVAVAGTVVLLLRRRTEAHLVDVAILALPSIALLGAVRLSSAIASSYGQDRLYIQLMPIVAVPVLWGLGRAWEHVDALLARLARGGWARGRAAVRGLLVAGVAAYAVFLVAISAGLPKAAAGDHSPANLFNGGEHYTRFYVAAPEVASAEWLARVQPVGSLTYTDEYGQLRIFGYGVPKGPILTDVTPRTVDVNAWVYATRVNVLSGQGRVNFDDQQIVYDFPLGFLADQLGVAYTNGTSEVFHR